MPRRERRQIIAQWLKSLYENLKLAQFCSARLSSGHCRRGDTKNARLKGGRYKTMPILSSHTDSSACLLLSFSAGPQTEPAPQISKQDSPKPVLQGVP